MENSKPTHIITIIAQNRPQQQVSFTFNGYEEDSLEALLAKVKVVQDVLDIAKPSVGSDSLENSKIPEKVH